MQQKIHVLLIYFTEGAEPVFLRKPLPSIQSGPASVQQRNAWWPGDGPAHARIQEFLPGGVQARLPEKKL